MWCVVYPMSIERKRLTYEQERSQSSTYGVRTMTNMQISIIDKRPLSAIYLADDDDTERELEEAEREEDEAARKQEEAEREYEDAERKLEEAEREREELERERNRDESERERELEELERENNR
jgi:chromosome segregation ATPase